MSKILQKENIEIRQSVNSWIEAIERAVNPLIKSGYVEDRYKKEIIENTNKFGPYYVLAPDIAVVHARPDQGAIKTQLGVLLLKEPVKFAPEGHDVRLIVAMASADAEAHMGILGRLGTMFEKEVFIRRLIKTESIDEIYNVFSMEDS